MQFQKEFERQSGVIKSAMGTSGLKKAGPTVLTVKNPKGVTLKFDPEKYEVKTSEGEVKVVPKA